MTLPTNLCHCVPRIALKNRGIIDEDTDGTQLRRSGTDQPGDSRFVGKVSGQDAALMLDVLQKLFRLGST